MNHPEAKQALRPAKVDYARIATEEAFAPAEMLEMYRKILQGPDPDPGFVSLMGFYMSSPSARSGRRRASEKPWLADRVSDWRCDLTGTYRAHAVGVARVDPLPGGARIEQR